MKKMIVSIVLILFFVVTTSAANKIELSEEDQKKIDKQWEEMLKGRTLIQYHAITETSKGKNDLKDNFSEDVSIEGESVYAVTGKKRIRLFEHRGKKEIIKLSPNKEKVAYYDKTSEKNLGGGLKDFTIDSKKVSGEGSNKYLVSNITVRIDDIIWLSEEEFLVVGPSVGSNPNNIYTLFNVSDTAEVLHFPARRIAVSPDKRFICMLRYMPGRGVPEEYMSDYVDVFDIKSKYLYVAYPFKNEGEKEFTNLDERYFVVSGFLWKTNNEVFFVCDHNKLSYLVKLTYNKSTDEFICDEKKLNNYFLWVSGLNLNNNGFEIKGKTSKIKEEIENVFF